MATLPPEGARIRLVLTDGWQGTGTVESVAPDGLTFAFKDEDARYGRSVELKFVWAWREAPEEKKSECES